MASTDEDDSVTLDVDSATHAHTAGDVELTTDSDD
jgi:hypothetical protein